MNYDNYRLDSILTNDNQNYLIMNNLFYFFLILQWDSPEYRAQGRKN